MTVIEAHNIRKSYGTLEVLHDVDLSVREGEILALIGPSGSGKSTLLRLLDLIEPANDGQLSVFGIDTVADRGSWLDLRRRMGMLFQRPIVFNSSVYDNVAMGLRYRRAPAEDIDRKVKEALEAVGLSRYIKSRAIDLSGGEQQRVALSRVLVTDPEILFLDEPTANLDPTSTATIEAIVTRLNREAGMTVLISTHDLAQGQRLAHRVGVMIEGTIAQTGPSREVFREPKNQQIARFVGVQNIIPARVISRRGEFTVVEARGKELLSATPPPADEVEMVIRGEDISLHRREPGHEEAENLFPATVTAIEPTAPFVNVAVRCGCDLVALVTARRAEALGLHEGMEVWVSLQAKAVHLIPRAKSG
ncbi:MULTISPECIES: ABC transporter ATP-binding protein [Methanoculleus]|uniref:Molybdate/tungstate import ATP-binding protein WtpC n=2 Tax=Methanoculleus TaxID=45989 RepID=A3CWQ5_METMJ|nr:MULTISPECIES: ABC transporter ATP-binding protein [Methanoculleus]ABN57805.1 carbohydrate ABC transporter ATP-binding protein, CUT1 family [Methanoculleus marisnigri JR1]MCC7556341.1 ABC transporter ATP-binding protein [Methanoculleus marisnigri]UYU19193.1 ABC transporter ATP-binding protein [Methanoculleus submarinus]